MTGHALTSTRIRAAARICGLLLALAVSLVVAPPSLQTAAPAEASPEFSAALLPAGAGMALPPGFSAQVFARDLGTPRFLSFSPEGDLYVADMQGGRVLVLPDRDHDGAPDRTVTFASGLSSPNNVAFYGGAAYVGETGRILRFDDANRDLVADSRQVVAAGLPANGRHRTKTVGFGPDGKMYVNVGSFSDDAPESSSRATIWQFNPDGSGGRVFAGGLRNTVGFDWDPTTGRFWGADNGADDLGRNSPADELNLLVDGGNYGFPFCTGDRLPNPLLPTRSCAGTIAPTVGFPAHSAPLGVAFYTGWSFPEAYWGGLFAAQHSIQYPENRAIVFIPFKNGMPGGPVQTFQATGAAWLGLAVSPYDGALYASQDRTGIIYKISYTGSLPAPSQLSGPPPPSGQGKPAPQPALVLPGASRCFSQTGKCLRGAFLNYWFSHGGLSQFGLPVTGELTEKLADGKSYTVQYTERARLEWHPENRGREAQVLLGRLGADLAAPRSGEQPFTAAPNSGTSARVTRFAQTGHTLQGPFLAYWQRNGGLPVFGYPLSEAFNEKSPTDGKTYLVQYFERNRLEYHPEAKGTQYEVQLGLLGVQSYRDKYSARP